jgi:hypothetical protein
MSIVLVLQLAIAAFVVLFFLNWVVTMSSQTIKGFHWGDFVLIFIVGIVILGNAGRLKDFAGIIPDAVDWMMSKPSAKLHQVENSIHDTRQTVNAVSEYLKGVAERELEYQMRMNPHK